MDAAPQTLHAPHLHAPAPPPRAAFDLHIPAPKVLSMREELELARAAVARQPESKRSRLQLARMLGHLDHFAEELELLRSWNINEYPFLDQTILALLSQETEEADREALELCHRQMALDLNPLQASLSLSTMAKLQIRLSLFDEARATLTRALALKRDEKDAYKRVTSLDFQAGRPEDVLSFADSMLREGVTHSRVTSSQTLALARLGMIEEARNSQGSEDFLVQFEPAPPPGWDTLQAFNLELAAEIGDHPNIRYGRYGTASSQSWRVDEPSLRRCKAFPALQRMVVREVNRYVDQLPQGDHPFLQGRLGRCDLRNWCVITEGDGHELWHVHQNGWISGVYYPYVQDHIAQGTGKEGCIAFGLPEAIVGAENARAFGEVIVRPRTGLMMIFPSHTFHRTFPHYGDGRRIVYAFDIIPPRARYEG